MEKIPLYMTHNLQNIDFFPLADGYKLRFYEEGDDKNWANIVTKTNEFSSEEKAIQRFSHEFQPFLEDVKHRMIFLETVNGEVIGTCTAWYGNWQGKEIGRLHWVEIIPDYQGKKLAKPLVTAALNCLREFHDQAFLKTQTTSLPAVKMYVQLGFVPEILNSNEKRGWRLIEERLEWSIL